MRRIVFGAGGTGRTIASVVKCADGGSDLAFLDDAFVGQVVNGIPVLGRVADYEQYEDAEFIIGFGTRYHQQREALWARLVSEGRRFFNAVFPHAYVDSTATMGIGNLVAANCALLPNSSIGNDCILCVSVTVDHDCRVGDHCYLSPGVNLAGGAILEDGVFVGTNATILPLVRIGSGSIVGAGALVRECVPPGQTVVGVPAKPIRKSKANKSLREI